VEPQKIESFGDEKNICRALEPNTVSTVVQPNQHIDQDIPYSETEMRPDFTQLISVLKVKFVEITACMNGFLLSAFNILLVSVKSLSYRPKSSEYLNTCTGRP
jgi:hypothetical protein